MFWSAEAKHGHEFNWINYDCVLLEEKSYTKYMVPGIRIRRIRYNQEMYKLYWSLDIIRTTKAAGL
jgi:hypothetical protein